QPGDAPVSDPLPDAPDAALDRQADDAQPGDAPRPATPSPWGTPLDEALTAPSQLLAHIDRLLEGQRQSIQTWRVILDAPLLDSDPFLRRMVEGRIIAYLSRTDVHSYENRQAFATLADARFGWRIDGIGLLRRHPNAHGILEMLPKPRRQPDPARQPETGRRLPLWARWPVALIAVTIPVALLMAVFGNTLPEGSSFGDLSASVLGPLTAMCMLLAILFLPGLVVWKIFSFIVRRFFWWHRLEAAFWRRWRNGRLGRFSPVDVFATALVVVAALVLTPVFTEMINWSGETRQQTPEDMPGYQRILPPAAP
ncbi:MAG: hypothetical protein Q4G26_04205, partial [Paracoccus sp. (in: a-proteobacteria)]|nr:hypothetical protein [Paracoccus sp. (in: a-proteobacteria)]